MIKLIDIAIIILLAIATAVIGLGVAAALAQESQPQCNERDAVLAMLAKKYHEVPAAGGVTNKGGLVEVLTAHDGDTWTIIVTTPQGMSCLVAAGEGWRTMKRASMDPEA